MVVVVLMIVQYALVVHVLHHELMLHFKKLVSGIFIEFQLSLNAIFHIFIHVLWLELLNTLQIGDIHVVQHCVLGSSCIVFLFHLDLCFNRFEFNGACPWLLLLLSSVPSKWLPYSHLHGYTPDCRFRPASSSRKHRNCTLQTLFCCVPSRLARHHH